MIEFAGPVQGEACRRQVRDLCGLRGAQRVLKVGMVPVDQDLRRGRAHPGMSRNSDRKKLSSNFLKGPLWGQGTMSEPIGCSAGTFLPGISIVKCYLLLLTSSIRRQELIDEHMIFFLYKCTAVGKNRSHAGRT